MVKHARHIHVCTTVNVFVHVHVHVHVHVSTWGPLENIPRVHAHHTTSLSVCQCDHPYLHKPQAYAVLVKDHMA